MNTRNKEGNTLENNDASIKSEDDLVQKILAKLELKAEDIRDLKLGILSLRDQVRGGNKSHTDPPHNIVHKVNINLLRFNGENNRQYTMDQQNQKNILKCTISMMMMSN